MVDRLQGREVGRRGGFELKRISVAIDGPSGAGKSTLARMAAKELGYIYVDTGAIYRAVALYTIRCGVSADNPADIVGLLEDISIKLGYKDGVQRIMLNGEDVSEEIRSSDVTVRASVVSAIPKVREFLLGMQRSMAAKGGVIMDGRDIGTVVLPGAEAKIFLTASDTDRAERRYKELVEKGTDTSFDQVLESIRQRDKRDSERSIAPLKPAEDAVIVDTSGVGLDDALNMVMKVIRERM